MELTAGGGGGSCAGRHCLAQGCGQPSQQRVERESGGLWGAGKGTRLLWEGREPNYAKSYLCFQREGTGLRTILLATNNLKVKLRTA